MPMVDRGGLRLRLSGLVAAAAFSCACASAGAVTGPVAFPRAPGPAAFPSAASGPAVPMALAIAGTALSFVGTPYRLGGDTPADGFDCSGLVRYALAQQGIDVPRTVTEQYVVGRPVAQHDLQPGDLVFFSTIGPGATHVGIVLEGASHFVHAPNESGDVRVERFDTAYWRARFVGARRVY
jgi:cell wall-associated NlpC family hydrolase